MRYSCSARLPRKATKMTSGLARNVNHDTSTSVSTLSCVAFIISMYHSSVHVMSANLPRSVSVADDDIVTNSSSAETDSPHVIQLNVGGELFLTYTSTLIRGSTYFAKHLSPQWIDSAPRVGGGYFVDAEPRLFRHLLNYLRRSLPPIFWSRTEGFDYPLYAALHEEARYFGIDTLERWIADEGYLASISIKESIETVDLKDCLSSGSGFIHHPDDRKKRFHPSDLETKGGLKRKRLEVQKWTFQAPVSGSPQLSRTAADFSA